LLQIRRGALADEDAVAIAALGNIAIIKRIPDFGMAQGTAPAIAGNFVCIVRYGDYFGFWRFINLHNLFISSSLTAVIILPVNIFEFPAMPTENNITYIENPVLNGNGERYMTLTLDVRKALESWRQSVFSFEWMHPDGRIKTLDELSEGEKPKRVAAEKKYSNKEAFEQPVLGIGIMENIEIGSGRADFLTLAAHGVKTIRVHIPKSNESDFKAFRADVKS
jgi:hypothetical protein